MHPTSQSSLAISMYILAGLLLQIQYTLQSCLQIYYYYTNKFADSMQASYGSFSLLASTVSHYN